jgi:hypothetical protein
VRETDPETAFPDHAPAKGMPSCAKLSRADLSDLVAYVGGSLGRPRSASRDRVASVSMATQLVVL